MFSESSPPLKPVEEDCVEPEDTLNIAANTDNQEETGKGDAGCRKSFSMTNLLNYFVLRCIIFFVS